MSHESAHNLTHENTHIKQCLVTGASGFIGLPLCEFLKKQGFFVRALLRKPIKSPIRSQKNPQQQSRLHLTNAKTTTVSWDEECYGDLKNLANLDLKSSHTNNIEINDKLSRCTNNRKQKNNNNFPINCMQNIDTVFHLAGIAHASTNYLSKDTYYQVNVEATQQLLHLAHQAGVKRFIYFSSVKAATPTTNKNYDKDYYSQSKKAAEDCIVDLGKQYGMHVSILRPALVYGPNVKGNLAMMIRGIRQGWFPPLPETKNKRSLISIEDLLDVALLLAKSPLANGKIYTVTDGHCYSSRQLYDMISNALGKSSNNASNKWAIPYPIFKLAALLGDAIQWLLNRQIPFNSEVLDKLLGSAYYSSAKLEQDLQWKPKIDFRQGIEKLISDQN